MDGFFLLDSLCCVVTPSFPYCVLLFLCLATCLNSMLYKVMLQLENILKNSFSAYACWFHVFYSLLEPASRGMCKASARHRRLKASEPRLVNGSSLVNDFNKHPKMRIFFGLYFIIRPFYPHFVMEHGDSLSKQPQCPSSPIYYRKQFNFKRKSSLFTWQQILPSLKPWNIISSRPRA